MDKAPTVPQPPFRKQLKFLTEPRHMLVFIIVLMLRDALVFQVTEQSHQLCLFRIQQRKVY